MENITDFNKSLKFFMRELIKMYPNLTELKLMFSFYKMMKTVNKRAPQQYFHNLIDVNSKELLSKNFDFFLDKEYEDPQIAKIFNALKNEFLVLDQENKEMIWKHLVVLYHLSLKCEKN